MGSIASTIVGNGVNVSQKTHPRKADWITSHATSTSLAVVEVERLWLRFQQLGCDKDGTLARDTIVNPPLSNDAFMKNILISLLSPDERVYFESFLNAMKWAALGTIEEKIEGIFNLINSGNKVDKHILGRVFQKTYPEYSLQQAQRLADAVIDDIDTDRKGYCSQGEFIDWVRVVEGDSIESVLDFHIIPPGISADVEQPSWASQPAIPQWGKQIPSDELLHQIAMKIWKRDWPMVANKLGFTTKDVEKFRGKRTSSEKEKPAYEMLKAWKQKEGEYAYNEVLEVKLRESKMNDVAMLLQP